MIGNWTGDGDPLLSTTLSNQSGRCYHLTVERLAANTWEWLAWRAADAPEQHSPARRNILPGYCYVSC